MEQFSQSRCPGVHFSVTYCDGMSIEIYQVLLQVYLNTAALFLEPSVELLTLIGERRN